MSELILEHLLYLSVEIGPRGSCTEGERRGHEYCRKIFEDLSYEVYWEKFHGPLSAWHPFTLGFGTLLLAGILYYILPNGGALVATALSLLALVSLFLQLTFRNNPLNWILPSGSSQNVWVRAKPKSELLRNVVIIGHVDTHRTVWAMGGKLRFLLLRIIITLALIAGLGLLGIFIISLFVFFSLLKQISLLLCAIILPAIIFSLWPDLTEFVPGANDNATGAATVLDFAARLKKSPLLNTAVYLVITGCEEVGAYGAAVFAETHPELDDADYFILDSIGALNTQVRYVVQESFFLPIKSDPNLIEIASKVAKQNEEYRILPWYFKGAFTDLSPLARRGRRAISFINLDIATHMIPNWHQPTDVPDGVDTKIFKETQDYIWSVLKELDKPSSYT